MSREALQPQSNPDPSLCGDWLEGCCDNLWAVSRFSRTATTISPHKTKLDCNIRSLHKWQKLCLVQNVLTSQQNSGSAFCRMCKTAITSGQRVGVSRQISAHMSKQCLPINTSRRHALNLRLRASTTTRFPPFLTASQTIENALILKIIGHLSTSRKRVWMLRVCSLLEFTGVAP